MQILGAFHSRKPTSRIHQSNHKGRSFNKKELSRSTSPKLQSRFPKTAAPPSPSSTVAEDDSLYVDMILADDWSAWETALKILPVERVKAIEAAARYTLAIESCMDAWNAYDSYEWEAEEIDW